MDKKIYGVYLAAGKSLRYGKKKLSQKVMDKPLGSIALETILRSRISYTGVVCPLHDQMSWIPKPIKQLRQIRWEMLPCQSSGQAHSINIGLQFAQRNHADAIVVFLADQPFISLEMIDTLIHEYGKSMGKNESPWFISSSINQKHRPPVLFTQKMYPYLQQLRGDIGARHLLQKYMDKGVLLDFPQPRLFFDVDTTEDMEKIPYL